MRRRPFVQRTLIRKQMLRRRRIHTSFADTWERLRTEADRMRRTATEMEPQQRAA